MTRTEKRQHWQLIINRQAESGLTKAAFCQQETINPATFYYWTKRLREQPEPAQQTVIPVMFSDEPVATELTNNEQLLLTLSNGNQLAFPATLEPSRLQQFAMALSV